MNAPEKDPKFGHTDRYGLSRGPVATEPMVSAEYFQQEKEKIFRNTWLNMLRRGAEIPNPGDFFVRDIEMLGISVIVVRGDDGRIRAFHNSCTHRGNKLVHSDGKAACDSAKGFGCGFHGWTFNNRGELAYVPDEEQFFDLDKKSLGLNEITCELWRDVIFINLYPQEAPGLEASLGHLATTLAPFPFDEMICAGRYRVTGQANWKITMNAFQEGYHVVWVHGRSFPDAFTGADNPYCHIEHVDLDEQGNQTLSVPGAPDHEPSPTEALVFKFGATFSQGVSARDTYAGTNPGKVKDWGFDLNIIFPFSRLNVGAGWYYSDAFWPVAHDKTVYELAYYFPRPRNAGEMICQEYSKVLLRDSAREDLSTNEATHKSLAAGAIKQVMFSDQEVACRHLYAKVDEKVTG
ncbi:MAG: aromatic ring-hydroxylating dioxygenase subunit alpha [Pseudomonadota bacterium]|nr:aromatic ring-hydroxylating dioxygenase subunit alpha [Pseudomonadota bacterium]